MKVIWKYPLKFYTEPQQLISMPKNAKILTVQLQYETHPMIWALVDPDAEKVNRVIRIFATGEESPLFHTSIEYIGTFQRGMTVWHVYDCGEEEEVQQRSGNEL